MDKQDAINKALNDQIKKLVEGFKVVGTDLVDLEKKVDALTKRVDALEKKVK